MIPTWGTLGRTCKNISQVETVKTVKTVAVLGLFSILDNALNNFFEKSALFIGNRDLVGLAKNFVTSWDFESTIIIHIKANVRKLHLSDDISDFLHDSKISLAYRSTNQKLYLTNGANTSKALPEVKSRVKGIMDLAQEFKQLEELELEVSAKKNVFELESYLQTFSTLKSLIFRPYVIDTSAANEDMPHIDSYPTLKQFYAQQIILNDVSAQYLMHKLSNLDSIEFKCTRDKEPIVKDPFVMSPKVMAQFFDYVVKMRSYNIEFNFNEQQDNMINVVKRFIDATKANKKDTMLMIEYSNDQSHYPFARIKNPSRYEDRSFSSVIIDTTTTVIEVHYDRIATVNPANVYDVVLPHLELLRRIGSQVKHLS